MVATSEQENCQGVWRVCDPSTIGGFSAVGYLFGRELLSALDVPVGLLGSNWGGTRAEAWTSEAGLRGDCPEFDEQLDQIAALRSDPLAVEAEAREKLGMVREGEVVVRFAGDASRAPGD